MAKLIDPAEIGRKGGLMKTPAQQAARKLNAANATKVRLSKKAERKRDE